MNPTTILLIRHGQTDWNITRRWQGHINMPLNELGITQSKLLAERLKSWPIEAIYSSDLRRAAQTAAILGETLGLKPILDVSWRERHGGDFQGMTIEELEANYPVELKRIREEGGAPPGGESFLELENRIVQAYQELANQYEGKMVAVVSHGGAMGALIAHVLGFPPGVGARITL